MKKTGGRKFRWTVPLNKKQTLFLRLFLYYKRTDITEMVEYFFLQQNLAGRSLLVRVLRAITG